MNFAYKKIALLLIVIQLVLMMPQIEFSNHDVNAIDNTLELKPIVEAPIVNVDEPFRISYEDVIKESCTYSTECEGITAVLVENVDYLSFDVKSTSNVGFGRLTVNVTDNTTGNTSANTTYFYSNGFDTYYNEFTMDQAWYDGTKALYDLNTNNNIVLSYRDWEEEYSKLMSSILSGEPTVVNTSNEKVVISGNIYWELNKNYAMPFKCAFLEVIVKTDDGYISIGDGYTGLDGEYHIEIDPSELIFNEDVYIRINLEAKTFKVRSGWWTFPYYFDKKLSDNLTAGTEISYDACITHNLDKKIYKATYVHQTMVIAERFAEDMGFRTSNKIRVAYPAGIEYFRNDDNPLAYLGNNAFCWGNENNNCFCVIGWHNYNNTKTIVHEYSHYIQCSLNNFGEGIPDIIFMSTHDGYSDYFELKDDKSFGMHLAWAEGWGYAFSTMAQAYYFSEYQGMTNREVFIDTNISTSEEEEGYKGEFQELSVKAFLWNLVDQSSLNPPEEDSEEPVEPEELDYQLPWTPQEWWNMTTISGTCRFPDFMRLIEEEGYDESMDIDYKSVREGIAEYLTKYNIAPQINSITYTSGTPTINLMVNGSEAYPNNRLVVKVFDENNNLLAESDMIEVDRERFENFNLSIPDDVWDEVLSNYSCANGHTAELKFSVEGYRFDDFEESGLAIEEEFQLTGPYYSEYYSYSINLSHNYELESVNESNHRQVCSDCGLVLTTSAHNMKYVSVNDQYHKQVCSDCGYTTSNSLHLLKSSELGNRYKYCTACGHTVITGGNLILPVGPDGIIEEEYTE